MPLMSNKHFRPLGYRCAALIALSAMNIAALPAANAALSDEIQVYTDDINAPHETGLELHVNTTPQGRKTPDYPGEVTPYHGLRITPEFSWGLTNTFEAGLYLPTNKSAGSDFELAGAKLRLKWLPVHGDKDTGGWFLGANGELSHLLQKFSESQSTFELRTIGGYHGEEWMLAVNPVFGWNLSNGLRSGTPDFSMQYLAQRKIAEGLSVGVEYYSDMGTTSHILPASQQDNSFYATVEVDRKTWGVNVGVGRGLTSVADKWTVRAIFELPF